MPALAFLARVLLGTLLAIFHAQAAPETAAPATEGTRIRLKENAVSCFILSLVQPVYPRAARLAHTEGAVKLELVIAPDGSVTDVQATSGEPLLVDSAVKRGRLRSFGQPFVLRPCSSLTACR